jgi:hypothetical protein
MLAGTAGATAPHLVSLDSKSSMNLSPRALQQNFGFFLSSALR